ncbi:MAG: hypothetical protein EAZ89_01065 [Bacteroidetes bacterium]|nr:MAG: hypothetical protein EAZ89_01065 [Bacteroidota bacterium]
MLGVGNRFQTVSPVGVKPNDDFWKGLVPNFREGKKQVPTLTVGVRTGIALGGRRAAANKN